MNQSRKISVLLDSVKKLVRRNDYKHVANILRKIHSADIAYVLNGLTAHERVRLFLVLCQTDIHLAAQALSELGVEQGIEILSHLPEELGARILQEMDPDDAAAFLGQLPTEQAGDLLARMSHEDSAPVRGLLQYDEETAGRIMNTDVLAVPDCFTVAEAIQAVQQRHDEAIYFYMYVVDDQRRLVGVISLKHLLLHGPETRLRSIMKPNVITVTTETDQEEVARLVANYNLLAIPVVDENRTFVGVITVDDIIDVIKEEATEDLFYLAGVEADDHTYSPPWSSIRKRIPWLGSYLGIGLVTAWVISMFQGTLDRFIILALFMPMVGGMAGNAGTQVMTVAVRGMAVGELTGGSGRRFFFKELRVGLVNGLALGILAGLISAGLASLWGSGWQVGLVMFLAMWINIVLASVWGTTIPMALKALRFDPALASGIFVTTLNDVFGFLSFLGLATILFALMGL